MTHVYDPTCGCPGCRHELALKELPRGADPVAAMFDRNPQHVVRHAPLHEMCRVRAAAHARIFPVEAAAELAAWHALAIESIGDTPASRGASYDDLLRSVRQQLSLLEETRAKFLRARTLARSQRETLEHIHTLLVEGDYDDAEAALEDATLEPRVDDVIADAVAEVQVDVALTRAGEAVRRG